MESGVVFITHLNPLFNVVTLLPFLELPLPTKVYDNANLAHKEIKSLAGKPGVYLWTHKPTGRQYIGSSGELFNRLSDYFQPSQLKVQAINSKSLICRAILKYSLSEFSLAILVLNTTESFKDLEQSYLDKYALVFNSRRLATTAAYFPSPNLRKAVYIYDSIQKTLLAKFETINQFQLISGMNGTLVKELMLSTTKLWRNTYFLSATLILAADNSMSTGKLFTPVKAIGVKNTYPIYAYDSNSLETLIFKSQADCIKNLGGAPQTLLKCLNNNTLFKGYRVSRVPLSNPFN